MRLKWMQKTHQREPVAKLVAEEMMMYYLTVWVAIYRLEDIKTDLQNRIAEKAKGNAILQASLERRMQALQECRSALDQDVARLKKQLQQEKDLRVALEAGLHLPFGHLTISATTNDRTDADLEEIPLAEADVINLKQQAEDFHVHICQQLEWNNGFLCGSCSQHSQPQHYTATLNDKQKDAEVPLTSFLNESLMRSKDINTSSTNIETAKKQATQHLPIKQLLHKQQLCLTDDDNIISSWLPATSPVEALVEPAASSTARKFALRSEVSNICLFSVIFSCLWLLGRCFLLETSLKSYQICAQKPGKTHKSEGYAPEEQFLKKHEKFLGSEAKSLAPETR